jgi:uncharacterized lipoprotein YmbA
MKRATGGRFRAAVIAVAGLTACGTSEESRLYLLSPIAESQSDVARRIEGPTVLVAPVDLPKHLDRPQIVTFNSRHRLDAAEFDRWAEPLADNFARVVAENLGALLPGHRVYLQPPRLSSATDHQVTIDVIEFGMTQGRSVVLIASWWLTAGDARAVPVVQRFTHRATVATPGIEAGVAAMSDAVGALTRDIASAIQRAPRR